MKRFAVIAGGLLRDAEAAQRGDDVPLADYFTRVVNKVVDVESRIDPDDETPVLGEDFTKAGDVAAQVIASAQDFFQENGSPEDALRFACDSWADAFDVPIPEHVSVAPGAFDACKALTF